MNVHSGYSSIDIDQGHTSYGLDLLQSSKRYTVSDEIRVHAGTASLRPTKMQRLKDRWMWEISSLVLSLVTIIAITIVLRILDGKPLSWWKSSISPNSLVSIFAAVSKSALILPVTECISQAKWLHFSQHRRRLYELQLFDDASRGPLGALVFLCQSMVNAKDIIASMAAVVMIAALAVDPFMQQIIHYQLRSVISEEINGATTPATRRYDSGTQMDPTTAKSNFAGMEMQTAIINGLLGTSLTPTFHCSTGNCTWPSITQLGVCGSCTNVTTQTRKVCGERDTSSSTQTCTYTTPASINITATNGLPGSNGTYTYINSSVAVLSADADQALLRLGILRSPPTADVDADGVLPPDIAECAFEWCAQRRSAFGVGSGVLRPGPLDSVPLNVFSPNGSWTPKHLDGRVYVTLEAPPAATWEYGDGHEFFVHTADYEIARNLLVSLLVTQLASFNEDTGGFQVAPILLFAGDLSRTMGDIAASMTNLVQRCANGTDVVGRAYRDETFVRVRWPWLILPAVLVLAAAVLLQAAVAVNRRRGAVLWKSSVLPLLFHGFEKPMDAPAGEKLSAVEVRAWGLEARLGEAGEGESRFTS